MKKLIFALAFLFSISVLAAPPPMTVEGAYPARDITFWGNVTISGTVTGAVSKTQADETYYVRTGGDDNNDCLTVGNACATPQGAVDKIPDYIQHQTVLDIGPGTFPAFAVSNRSVKRPGKLTIQGTLGPATLTSGNNTGNWTGNGVTVWECIDAGGTWTPSDPLMKGKIFRDPTSDEHFIIRDNTATSIEAARDIQGAITTCGTKAYEILEWQTEITGKISTDIPVVLSIEGVTPIDVETTQTFFPDPGTFFVQDLFFNSPVDAWVGFSAFDSYGHITRCKSEVSLAGYAWIGQATAWAIFDNYSTGNAGVAGFWFYYNGGSAYLRGDYSYNDRHGFHFERSHAHYVIQGSGVDNATWWSLLARDAGTFSVQGDRFFADTTTSADCVFLENIEFFEMEQNLGNVIENCQTHGIHVAQESHTSSLELDMAVIQNCGANAVYVRGPSSAELGQVTGAGNTLYGLRASLGAQIAIATGTAVTGASGDFTVNNVTANSWSDVDFNGETVLNMADTTCVKSAGQGTGQTPIYVDNDGLGYKLYPTVISATPSAPFTCTVSHITKRIYIDDTDDTAEAYLCFCGTDADDTSYIWMKVQDPSVNCFP